VLVIDAVGAPAESLDRLVLPARPSDLDVLVLCRSGDREDLGRALASRRLAVRLAETRDDLGATLAGVPDEVIAFSPLDTLEPVPDDCGARPASFLAPWVRAAPSASAIVHMTPRTEEVRGWIAAAALLRHLPLAGPPATWTPLRIAAAAKRMGRPFVWTTVGAGGRGMARDAVTARRGRVERVLVMVPHRNTPHWLEACLVSILNQTQPPEAVVVMDDASSRSPVDVVSGYPSVTLLRSSRHVGPYALLQHMVDATCFDAYAVQDADDWSAADRLERQLVAMNSRDLDLVGCQELRVVRDGAGLVPVDYPVDVNGALRQRPGAYPSLHGTWLGRRRLFECTGGYATGLRFSGDSELVRRAAVLCRIENLPEFAYFRRDHPASLTNAPETGLHSADRRAIAEGLQARAQANASAAALGRRVDLRPLTLAAPVSLDHVCGPVLI
jgi:hypothetical protein